MGFDRAASQGKEIKKERRRPETKFVHSHATATETGVTNLSVIIIPEAGDFVNRNSEKTRVPRFRGRRSGLEHEKIPENGDEKIFEGADPPGRDPPKRGEVREMEQKNTVRENRERLRLTQKQVADTIGIAESAYQRYEYGVQVPNVFMAVKIAKVLKVPVEELFLID